MVVEIMNPNQNFKQSSPRMIHPMVGVQCHGDKRLDIGNCQRRMEFRRVRHCEQRKKQKMNGQLVGKAKPRSNATDTMKEINACLSLE